jgi:hypothetical protein
MKISLPGRPRSRNHDKDQDTRNTGNRQNHSARKEDRVADIYAENSVRAAYFESGIAGNHDSKGIPEVEITESGSDKPKTGSEGSKIPHIPQIRARNEARRLIAEEV